jgi:sterol 14-demethylase
MTTTAARELPSVPKQPGVTPPVLGGGMPLLGHAVEFGRNPVALMLRVRRECGELGEFRLLNRHIVLMTGPAANEAFCRAPDEQLSQSEAYPFMTPVFGEGVVFDAPLDKQRQQLTMLMPALRDRSMRGYAGVIAQEVEGMLSRWGESDEIDLLDFTAELTTYTSSHCLLGREFREHMTSEFAKVYKDLEKGVNAIAFINHKLPLPVFWRRDRARKRLIEMITGIIDERRRRGHEGDDALQTLMESRYDDGSPLSPVEITGMLTASMFAGHHTSSGTTAWVLIELLRNPDYMKRVVAELESIYAGNADVTYHSLREIPELENAIKETLRLHPPLVILMRRVKYDLHYNGYTVPAGKLVAISPAATHMIPELFPNPETFDPDRYLPPRNEGETPFSWIAFGGGRHLCTGNAFAMMQIKAIFSILLRRYEFELVDPPESYGHDYGKMVVQPAQPCRVRYRRRQSRPS